MKVRRLILCAFLLLGGISLQAAPVSQSRALDVAKKVFAAQPATKAVGDVKLIWDGEDIATKSAVQPAFYVFGRDGGGFVIVAGDDNVKPVLALSDRDEFKVEDMPDNVKWWMESIKAYVRSAKTQSPEAARQWADFVATKAKIEEELLTIVSSSSETVCWNQHAPANELAPIVTGQDQAVCGCLPLAIAEILTWFGWPNTAAGSTEAYDSKMYDTQGHLVGYWPMPAYDLENEFSMTDEEWGQLQALKTFSAFQYCTDPVRTKLAKLVYACGVLVQASFNDSAHGGTGATSSNVAEPFSEHMKYNKGTDHDYFANHTPREWISKLKEQVLQHPVLYCGRAHEPGVDAGHAYVVDGYATLEEDDVFHFNFGWGGRCNGYYYASYQNTKGTDGGAYNFNYGLEAFFDFIPDKTGTSKAFRKLELVEGTLNFKTGGPYTFIGIATDAPIQKGKVNLALCYMNTSNTTYDGIVKIVLEDKAGGIKQDNMYVCPFEKTDGFGPYFFDYYRMTDGLYVTITEDLEFGDRLALYYTDDDDWTHFVRMGGSVDGSTVLELPVMPAAFIKTEATYKVGDYFQFQLMNNDYQYLGTNWTITLPDNGLTALYAQSDREFYLAQPGTYKIEAAVAPAEGDPVVETLVTYITVTSKPTP